MVSLYCNRGMLSCECIATDNWKEADISVWMLDKYITPYDVARVFERDITHPESTYAVLLDEDVREVADLLEWHLSNTYTEIGSFMDKLEEVLRESSI